MCVAAAPSATLAYALARNPFRSVQNVPATNADADADATTTAPATPDAGSALPALPHHAHWPRRLPPRLQVPRTSLFFNLEVAARRWPDKAASRFFGREQSYAALLSDAQALAGWLRAQGVQRGDRVLLFMQNCPQFLVAVYAILRADAVVVPVNPMNRAEEFRHYIEDAGARVALCAADLAGIVVEANAAVAASERLHALLVTRYADALPFSAPEADEMPAAPIWSWLNADPPLPDALAAGATGGVTRWPDALAAGHAPGAHLVAADDLAMLPYTSGTTGMPKGCMHTHATLMSNAISGQWSHGGPETVALGVVPMFHITGMVGSVLGTVYSGATLVILPRWDRELAGRLLSRRGEGAISHWTCIPTMVIDLLGSPNIDRFDLSGLRYLGGGGAAMPEAVATRLMERWGLAFAEGYGLTETAAPSHANPPERAKRQCLGMPYFGVDARVVDPQTLRVLEAGQVGEILIHGPMVFEGYWRHPEATAAAFVEIGGKRFFRSGDIGRMDEEGYFFLTDRLKRMINASGFKVWPSEVELLLFKCPLVQEACVIAAHDAYRGETVKAVIVPRAECRDSAKPEDVIAWAREHMAAYKVPRIVEFAESLPKSGSGKVMWRMLQEREPAG
jgi:fatty-acyl-CoA synthase